MTTFLDIGLKNAAEEKYFFIPSTDGINHDYREKEKAAFIEGGKYIVSVLKI